MSAGIENLSAGATASEGVIDGTPEITADNLFELVDSGKITLDEANEFIKAQESEDVIDSGEGVPLPPDEKQAEEVKSVPEKSEPIDGGVVPDVGKPFRVYNTQEEFQRDFNRSWNQRYGKQKEEQEKKDKEYNDLLKDLADMLGVEPSAAAEELRRRSLTRKAESEGKSPEDYIELENLRAENARLKESEESAKAKAIVDEINAQGAKIAQMDPAFDINEAMKNPEFARQVFFTRQTNPERAVEIAYKIFYQDKEPTTVPSVPGQKRPIEGAMSAQTTGARQGVDFSKMSSEDMRALDKKILKGEKVNI